MRMESLDDSLPTAMVRYTFANGATLYHATDTDALYTDDWPIQLERQAGIPLDSFDRVIVGTTSSCESTACAKPDGPSVTEFANIFQQPLLYVSTFVTYTSDKVEKDHEEFMNVHNHTRTMKYLDGRKYIKKMGALDHECGAASTESISVCVNNEMAAESLHRCIGSHGAHPDLIAFDLVEFMHHNYRPFESN